MELRCNVNRVCTGRIRIGIGFACACAVITHIIDVPAFDFVTRLYLCRELDRHTCRNIHTDSRITEDRRFIRLCRADIAAFACFSRRTEGDAGHQLDKADLNRRFTLQVAVAQCLARCGIRRGLAVDGPVLYAVACARHRRDRDIRVAVEAVRACIEVLPLVCAHVLAGDFCGNRAAKALVTERINGQGEVVLRERLRRCMNVYIAFDRATPGISGVIIFCSVDIRPTGNVPVVSLVAIIRCCRKYDIAAVLLDMIAGAQRLVTLLCRYGDVSVTAKGYRRLLCKDYLNQGILRNLDIILRYLTRLILLCTVIIERLRCTVSCNDNALDEVAITRCCCNCCRAVHIHMAVFTLSTSQYNILDAACASNFDCAVDRRIHRHLRLLRDMRDNLSGLFQTCDGGLCRILCIRFRTSPLRNVVILVYRSSKLNRRIIADLTAVGNLIAVFNLCGNGSDACVCVYRVTLCIHCLEGQRYLLRRIDYSRNRMRSHDIAQRKLLLRTRICGFLTIHLPRLDRVVASQIFQCKRYCRTVRNRIQICRCAVCQLRRGLHGRQGAAGFRLDMEDELMLACAAEFYLYIAVLLHIFQCQCGLAVQIGRTRPVIRLAVHHPACYRHTAVRRSRERHICAFRNLLSGRDCTAVLQCCGQLTAFAAAEGNLVRITAEGYFYVQLFRQRRYRQSFADLFAVRQNLRHLVLWITGNGLTVDLPFLYKETVVALGIKHQPGVLSDVLTAFKLLVEVAAFVACTE